MALTERLSFTSWKQSLKVRKQFGSLSPNRDVAKFCSFEDGTRRMFRITFENIPEYEIIDCFQITSGGEISLKVKYQKKLISILKNDIDKIIIIDNVDTEYSNNTNAFLNTTGLSIVKTRLGQAKFRKSLIKYWSACSVTNLVLIPILKASHIKPWEKSTDKERLDPFNGLLLTPNLDTLFDSGLITFLNNGDISISPLIDKYISLLGIRSDYKLRKIQKKHEFYLEYHRKNIFKN